MELGFKYDTIVDYCIPLAATKLGEAWVNDTLSFSENNGCICKFTNIT